MVAKLRNVATVTSRYGPRRGTPFQFGLRHLFWATMILSVYFALVRATGEFVATLVIGIYVLWCVITLVRIENMVLARIFGTCLATALVVCAGVAFGPPFWLFVGSCLMVPIMGYPLGVVCAGCRQMDGD